MKPDEALKKAPDDRTKKESELVAEYEKWNARLGALGELPRKDGDAHDASPEAIRSLKLRAGEDPELQAILDNASTPAPLRPALTRPLVDAWSMTALKKHTGRPKVEPWLRGWIEDEPQTGIVWRKHLPLTADGKAPADPTIESFFEAAPPHASEVLETETYRVIEWLTARAKTILKAAKESHSTAREMDSSASRLRRSDLVAIALGPAGDPRESALSLNDFVFESDDNRVNKKRKSRLQSILLGATLVVDARLAGLGEDGLLDTHVDRPPQTADDGESWLSVPDGDPAIRFRVRLEEGEPEQSVDDGQNWKVRFRFATQASEEGEASRWLIVDKWRHDSTTEDDRSAGRPQLLDTHQEWAEHQARSLAERLVLPDEYTSMLAIAARLHDEGKRAQRWQRAFDAPSDGQYAKTRGPISLSLLDGYRHEFGSLPVAAKNAGFLDLPEDLQDLALHVIAAHHGFARPVIRQDGCEDAPPSVLEGRAKEVALRFARLQKRWGPWGLAWWESLLRAADQQASRDNDAKGSDPTEHGS